MASDVGVGEAGSTREELTQSDVVEGASAALAVALVMFIGLMGVTVVLWEMGAMPEFTD